MNVVFISPQFPADQWKFAAALKNNGVNVLGIGDTPYDRLSGDCINSLNEYYYLSSLENYDDLYRAFAFFCFKYGKIDWVESNNEYWLEKDAQLRQDFNLKTGVLPVDLASFKPKSAMKAFYKKAKVPTASLIKFSDKESALAFIKKVGWPIIAKPDIGVGAADTYKLSNEEDLDKFINNKVDVEYVLEEFVSGDIYSYDAIVNSEGTVLFESSNVFPPSIMDIVSKQLDLSYYVLPQIPEQLRKRGRATLKAFNVKSRFVHFEFFRLYDDKEGLGKKDDFIGLEVNMRPAGGYTPDMMNFAHSCNVHQIWADMLCYDEDRHKERKHNYYCVYASKRDNFTYVNKSEDINKKYRKELVKAEIMPDGLASAMGNESFTALFKKEEEVKQFIEFVSKRKD